MLNNQGRPTAPKETGSGAHETFTRNRGLQMEEALLFEIGRTDVTGVDLDEPSSFVSRLGTRSFSASSTITTRRGAIIGSRLAASISAWLYVALLALLAGALYVRARTGAQRCRR